MHYVQCPGIYDDTVEREKLNTMRVFFWKLMFSVIVDRSDCRFFGRDDFYEMYRCSDQIKALQQGINVYFIGPNRLPWSRFYPN
jgi:hypothetical protein